MPVGAVMTHPFASGRHVSAGQLCPGLQGRRGGWQGAGVGAAQTLAHDEQLERQETPGRACTHNQPAVALTTRPLKVE